MSLGEAKVENWKEPSYTWSMFIVDRQCASDNDEKSDSSIDI